MIARQHITDLVVAWLSRAADTDDVSIEMSAGRDEVESVNGERQWKPNNTATLVIAINGGAQVHELERCTHPPDFVDDISTFGDERYRCKLCGAESTKPFIPPEG